MEHSHEHHLEEKSVKELIVLMKYMISHNEAHTKELIELLDELKKTENIEAYEEGLSSIEYFNKANEKLRNALAKIKE